MRTTAFLLVTLIARIHPARGVNFWDDPYNVFRKGSKNGGGKTGKKSSKGAPTPSTPIAPTPLPTRDDFPTLPPTTGPPIPSVSPPPIPTPPLLPTQQPTSPAPPTNRPSTARPSERPTPFPASSLTASPTPTTTGIPPTNVPSGGNALTLSPVVQATAQPSSVCISEGNLFGDPLFLEYGYEIETDPATIQGTLANVVLPPLEVAFNNFLLPELFPEICAVGRRRRLRLVGLSTGPVDEPRSELACVGNVAPSNDCTFVSGSLILFVDENEQVSVFEERGRERLKLGMDNDAFLSAHPSIKRVSFVEPNDPPEPTTNVVLPVVLAAGSVIIITGGVLATRKFSS
jgi:hypothetical protein